MTNKQDKFTKNGSTLFLRAALLAMGVVALILCPILAAEVLRHWAEEFPATAYAKYPIIVGLATSVIVFWVALYHAFKLLDLIDRNTSFSQLSVKTLQNIKYCALIIASVFAVGMPVVFQMAEKEDAPGLILIVGAIFIGAPIVLAVFASVCQRLFQNAIDIKKENDLTV